MNPTADEVIPQRMAAADDRPAASEGLPAILMVDDHPARLLTYEAILAGMPARFVRANSGDEALQLLLKQTFALILLDVNMPGIDGFEVARHVRAHPRLGKTPIVFVSGERLSDLDRLKGYEVGAVDYISVPIVPEILRSKVAVLIELFQRRAEFSKLNAATAEAKLERAAANDRVGATATHLRALFEQTTDIVFIVRGERDAEGQLTIWRYVDANQSALGLFKLGRAGIVGRTVHEIFPGHAPRASMLCQRALLGGERLQHEVEFAGRQLLVRMLAVDDECVAVTCTDITDRKRIEVALANSERRFQALLENCPVGVSQNGIDGRFEYVNAGFCAIVGYSAEELSALTWQQITHPDDLAADQGRAALVLAGKLPHYTIEKRYLRKDGSPVWVSLFGNFIYDDEHRPVQGVAVIVDITARKVADLALNDNRQRLQIAHDAAGLGSFDWNIRTDAATWDNRARELWGLAPDAHLTFGIAFTHIHPDDRPTVASAVERALRGEQGGRYRATYRVINVRDGRTRWVESHGQVIFENGLPVRMVGTKQDVTERARADHALRESEERFRELANNIDQIAWTCDSQGRPNWYNDRWYEFSGTPFQQMADEGWASLIHPDHAARVVEKYRRCIAAGETWEETFPVRSRHGEYRWFLSRGVPIRADDGTVSRWFGTNTDITSLRELQDALTDADRRKDEFLAMLAHELRNPVAPLLSVSEILDRKIADADLVAHVGVIRRQASHLARMLDDLLDVARITRGRIELRRDVFDIDECVALALETVDPMIRAGQHRLDVERPPAPLFVNGDRDRLGQCITNILSNAAKFSDPGTPISVKIAQADGRAVVEVKDVGRGIPGEMLPRIFELFVQGDRSLDRRSGGLGIGLSVCKRLIEMHGGALQAFSEGPGRGATFTLSLPIAEPVATAPASPAEPPVVAGALRVLIVDDNRDAADSIGLLLGMSGHECDVAYDGRQALEAWRNFRPDVVLLDIGLPGLDGYQVIRSLRESGYRGRAIAVSGYGQPEDRVKATAAGFDAHLVKPVDAQTLEHAIAEGIPRSR
jgi:PAS domain S-box-containing protein